MGLAGLTAVFGMGTGGAPPVSSPESGRGAIKPLGRGYRPVLGTCRARRRQEPGRQCPSHATWTVADGLCRDWRHRRESGGSAIGVGVSFVRPGPSRLTAAGRGGQAVRLLGPVGCDGRPSCTPGLSTWWSSRSLHGQLANGNLVSEGASRLDAFSAYPVPTWLPGGAPSGTAGTPEVGPPQSSRTRGDAPQVSSAHGR